MTGAPVLLRRLTFSLGLAAAAPADQLAAQEIEFAPGLGINLAEMRRTSRGVYLRDLTAGSGPTIGNGFQVTIHYTGWLPDGTQFDSSRLENEPVTFRLGDGRVIRGWEDGLRGMRAGGIRQIVVPPRLGYGGRGLPPLIPPNATLVFEIEVLRATR